MLIFLEYFCLVLKLVVRKHYSVKNKFEKFDYNRWLEQIKLFKNVFFSMIVHCYSVLGTYTVAQTMLGIWFWKVRINFDFMYKMKILKIFSNKN